MRVVVIWNGIVVVVAGFGTASGGHCRVCGPSNGFIHRYFYVGN